MLVVSQPTWGVDAGAAAAIHQALIDLAGEGAAVLVISQDLDELLEITDRFAVISSAGCPTAWTRRGQVEEIGLLMGGVHGEIPEPTRRIGRRCCRLRSSRAARAVAPLPI